MKFGFETERLQFERNTYFDGAGVFSFSSLTSFLQGAPNQFAGMTPQSDPAVYPRQSLYGMYAQ